MESAVFHITRSKSCSASCPACCISTFLWTASHCKISKMDVMVVETMKQTTDIPVPAITISVLNQINGHSCFDRNSSIESCLERVAPNQSYILKSVVLGNRDKKEILLTQENIRSDYTYYWPGIFYTLTLPKKIGPDLFKDQLFIGLNTNLTYALFIHDAEYFLINVNPTSTPSIYRKITTSAEKTTSWFYRLVFSEVNKLNLPRSPCVEDSSYSFLSCVRRSVASKVQERRIFIICDRLKSVPL